MQVIPITYPIDFDASSLFVGEQVVAIGDFDGVHMGHQEVIGRALRTAKKLGLPTAIMTFHPHPRAVMGQDKYVDLLTPMRKKMEMFASLGVSHTYIVTFDASLMRLSPEEFVDQVLHRLGVDSVICGFDFTFGYQGKGNPDTLCELSHGKFSVEVVRPFHMDGEKVSSTLIRESLQQGDIDTVTRLLGRPYSISGIVVDGAKRGRTIGFPTANLQLDESYVVPTNGVYAIKASLKGETYKGVMNIGIKPTFTTGELKPSFEAHLFDFSDQIYGEHMSVELIAFLRPERKFSSIDELVAQIKQDAELAKQKL
ncbi:MULTISPECIES: bifunctional riboflavin kinase/FAD synthetase [Paenibacillus]|uniref:Riboflavin biosynthesis protein n=2 Tax=Paenibacillus TaxID=44249 RepID=A0A1V4HSY5_9BACL|nr:MULTISPECIES: bifunctional riboflavin kinase/FAD synthetase [Paenibacillus]MEC0231519.1 bifunctional riboflavin kinase/FAD synthetase [Paenibacillus alba]NQX65810.1 bifunctional riboflavin kinase/FAD synthetase [Paenibacillus alba]OPH61976.1 riboflavin biosynthesis protein RibF [Paenibacillus ferrarius]